METMAPMKNDLKKIRKRLGATQAEMARRLGITQSYVSRIESGMARPSGAVQLLLGHMRNHADLIWHLRSGGGK